ncbi:MAG: GFA family protein [Proteobacteria bacterium]|nr:GFA family protein [Pseudomonadota bacterium]
MTEPYTGGCACGAIRYECSADPMFNWICHCRECQRSTGGGGAVNAVFHISTVRFIRGEPKFHESTGTTGHKTYRGFCAECGSPLAAKAAVFPEIHGISVASLDDPGRIELDANIWTGSVQPWDSLNPELPKFTATPTEQDLVALAKAKTSAKAEEEKASDT